ncbi:hypothetical protein [Saccharicrinis aurantiacus]|uniref:hypothetical protein n=1 Tax=Saccharicrinis aurantiacus TaxID=1849719 RepID=UPI002490D0B6|nr:hypothetical protein [Saccharicrinis aurantiacus]
MKNFIKIICVVLFAAMYSCEPDKYATPDIKLVPIYHISETENDDYFLIDIYKEKDLLLIENKDLTVSSFVTTDYVDASTEESYDVSFVVLTESVDTVINILSETTTQEIVTTINTIEKYDLGGSPEENIGDLNIEINTESSSVTTTTIVNEDGSESIGVGDPVKESSQDVVLINGTLTEVEVYN